MSHNLEGYDFIQPVGEGTMGSVYLARQTALNRFVAIKQMLGAWNGNPQALERFKREARALAKMNHPNVVGIYNLEAAGGELYMIQEYVHGPTLKRILANSRLSNGQALRVVGEVAAALEYAATHGIIHRDLKPGNVFVTTTGRCKLGDFGLVKMIGAQSNFVTQVGTILGTPSYMSPEQAAGKAELGQRTDVYSLAVLAYELLVGRLPFPGGNVMFIVEAHISMPPPPPSQVAPGFPPKVEEVLLTALSKDPSRRPKSAADFWSKLANAAQKVWPGWADDSDLSGIAIAAAPPAIVAQDAARTNSAPPLAAAPVAVPGQRWPISLVDPPVMAGSEETIVQPIAGMDADQTVALPSQPDEAVKGPYSADETIPMRTPADEETLVEPPQSVQLRSPIGHPAPIPPPPAAMPAPAAVAGPTSFSVPQVQAPVYKPPKTKARRRPERMLVPLLLLIALGAIVYFLLNRNSGTTVVVTGAEAVASPQVGHCPRATYLFTGKIFTKNGAGDITYQWVQPDGLLGQEAVQKVTSGQTLVSVTLQFTYTGNGSTTRAAHLKVLKPTALESAPAGVQYLCP
jgi:hypothetical protein